jgi:hypothetical protein
MQNYQQLRAKHSQQWNDLKGIFYAFSDQQFLEGLEKIGITFGDHTDKIYSIGGGGFMLKTEILNMNQLIGRASDELTELLKDEAQLLDALSYELMNHEYCETYDTEPALDALGLKSADVPAHVMAKAKESALEVLNHA